MSFANETRFAALPVPLLDASGRDVVVAIVKATYVVERGGKLRLADDQHKVRVADEPVNPDSPTTSIRFSSDVCVAKKGTDVIVVGDALPPRPAPSHDVGVKIKQRLVPIRVHGPRVYYDAVIGVSIGPAQPFERVPLIWELAYGGMSDDLSVVELRNPSGVGVAKSASQLVGTRAPQIEHPMRPHTSASDKYAPVGVAPIMTHWSPRREFAGTFDDAWQSTRMPLLPLDYDIRYESVASPELQEDEPLIPGDPLHVVGMSPEPLSLALPRFDVVVRGRFDGGDLETATPTIDTVILLPEARRVEIVGRVALPTGRGKRILRQVVVSNA
jgi:hypothetical protein